jgi:hypothetical protein
MNPMSMVHDSTSTNACPMCPGDPVRRPPQHQDQNQYCGTADTAVLATDAAHAVGPTSPTLIRSAPRIWSKSALLDDDWLACFRPTEPPPTWSDWGSRRSKGVTDAARLMQRRPGRSRNMQPPAAVRAMPGKRLKPPGAICDQPQPSFTVSREVGPGRANDVARGPITITDSAPDQLTSRILTPTCS